MTSWYKYSDFLSMIIDNTYNSVSYIISDGETYAIDCGFNINWASAPVKPEYVILTHGHLDHCYGGRSLNVPIYIHEKDYEYFEIINAPFWDSKKISEIKSKLEPIPKNYINKRIQIIETPGHTPGSVCYYLREYGYLFSGDTVFSENFDVIGRTDLPMSDLNKLQESLDKLKRLYIRKLFPGHARYF